VNRSAAAGRRAKSSPPRLHLTGPSDLDVAKTDAAEPFPRRRASLHHACAELKARKEQAKSGAEQATHRQLPLGKMTVRERLEALLDDESFVKIGALARHRATGFGLERSHPDSDGVVTGWGTVDGRKVFVDAHDFRIFGGSLGEVFATKIHTLMDLAAATGAHQHKRLASGFASASHAEGRFGLPRCSRQLVRQSAHSPQESHQPPSIPGAIRWCIPLCPFGMPSFDATNHKASSNPMSAGGTLS
jgi:hypothetical protein